MAKTTKTAKPADRYIITKGKDKSVTVVDKETKNSAVQCGRTLVVNIDNNKLTYIDGKLISTAMNNASVTYSGNVASAESNDPDKVLNNTQRQQVYKAADKAALKAESFLKQLAADQVLNISYSNSGYAKNTQAKFAGHVDANNAAKKAKTRVTSRQGSHGVTNKGELYDPSAEVAKGNEPTYSTPEVKLNGAAKSPNGMSYDEMEAAYIEAKKKYDKMDMGEFDEFIKNKFDKQYGKGSYDKFKKTLTDKKTNEEFAKAQAQRWRKQYGSGRPR